MAASWTVVIGPSSGTLILRRRTRLGSLTLAFGGARFSELLLDIGDASSAVFVAGERNLGGKSPYFFVSAG